MACTQFSVNELQTSPKRRIDCKALKAITGINTLSSRLPEAPAMAMVVSFPITCAQTIVIASLCVGLVFPGIMELTRPSVGRKSSPIPQCGPLPSQRMSFAILLSEHASVLNAPLASTTASRPPRASNLFGADTNGKPVSLAIAAVAITAYSGWVFKPVSDCSSANRQFIKMGETSINRAERVGKLRCVTGEHLTERQRGCILQVCAPNLHNVFERFGFVGERGLQTCYCGN